jgi:pectate lyase
MTSATFSKIDNNQIATQRQVYGVACHFANIASKTPTERYGLTKVFNAILNKHYKDSDSYMTHGEATEWFEWDCVPPQFMSLIKKPKASTVKKTAKSSKKATPKGKATEVKSTAKPTASDKKMQKLEKRVDILDRKLDKILDALTM